MTVGSGLSINVTEQDQGRQNLVIRQLIEGRSNAVGTATLTANGAATSTVVTAPTCGPNSLVFLTPQTANAASALATGNVYPLSVASGGFVVSHPATAQNNQTFGWFCVG